MFSSCDNIYTCLVLNIQLNDPGTWWILICELPFVDMTYAFCNLFFPQCLACCFRSGHTCTWIDSRTHVQIPYSYTDTQRVCKLRSHTKPVCVREREIGTGSEQKPHLYLIKVSISLAVAYFHFKKLIWTGWFLAAFSSASELEIFSFLCDFKGSSYPSLVTGTTFYFVSL